MSFMSRIVGRLAKLPPAKTHAVVIERDLQITMPDGAVLLADHYAPRRSECPPTILVRCPYGRAGVFGLIGHLFAERGFQVLMQSTRGTFGSGGVFDPYGHEHDDGLATIAWLKQQAWFSGALGMNGPSYLGYVQWAVARDAQPDVQAMAIQVSTSNLYNLRYPGGSFGLANALYWTHLIAFQEERKRSGAREQKRKLVPLFAHLPLRDLDEMAIGRHSSFFQDWLANTEPDSDYWHRLNFEPTVREVTTPIHLTGGWYDIFLPWQVRDYRLLREAGGQPYLTIGPWAHSSMGVIASGLRESLAWFNAHLLNDRTTLSRWPVRLFVTGANEWRSFPDWPPPESRSQRFYFQSGGGLALGMPDASEPDHYRYDPTEPTPAVAGPDLEGKSLPTDNRLLEARPDVLTYTGVPLAEDLEVIGPVQADLFARSSLKHTDFFVRLCDVDRRGKSINVCDALLRVRPGLPAPVADGVLHLTFDLWPTAHRFRRGHRLRVQVSSGAHPRYARNTGSGEPVGTATKLVVADQSIYHDPDHPSAVVLSVTSPQD